MQPPWWQPRAVLRRYVVDLLADELGRHRRAAVPHGSLWLDTTRLDADLGADSLELVTLATALAEAVHLHESGIEDFLLVKRTVGDWIDLAAAGLERYSERLTFRTSGSTGVPKPCMHALATLQQETTHLATLFAGRRRVLCAVPAHHIYGFLFSVLLPQQLGLEADSFVDLRGSSPAWLARGAQPGDLVIGFPEFWQAVGRSVPRLPPDVVGVTSTAPCPDGVSEAVAAAGIARLVHVYGASETAGIGARASHHEPYTLFPYWHLRDDGWLQRTLPDGGVSAFAVQDQLQACGARQFRVGPRHDQAVQVGGVNVYPARVREVLLRHPAVQDAAVRLMRPEEGTRLKAFVVPKAGTGEAGDLATALQGWIERELTVAERPKAIRFGTQVPATAAGKGTDWDLVG